MGLASYTPDTTAFNSHSFVVPGFGEPRWLDRCLRSLADQTTPSPVLVTTSTPTSHIVDVSAACGVPVVVNPVSKGIAADWNFALSQARTEWVTLAHQDDWYEPQYVEDCLAAAQDVGDAILVYCAAHEARYEQGPQLINARVKTAISDVAFLGSRALRSRLRKRLLLSFGNPLPCPAVMIRRARLPGFAFPVGWESNLDWHAWLRLSDTPGAFVYVRKVLVQRAIHGDATTTRALSARAHEDARMFHALWPHPIATILSRLYVGSHRQYRRVQEQGHARSTGDSR